LAKQFIKPNLAGSIYARSSIKHLHMVPFGQQAWPPRAILFSDWLLLKQSFIEDLAYMLPAKFSLIWPRSFRGEDLFNGRQSETTIGLHSHVS
jgi:hypothetical protein